MINKIGMSIVPRGMPKITGDQSEQLPVNMTCCLLFVKKFLIHSNREPSILCRCSFSTKRSCGTQERYTSSTCLLTPYRSNRSNVQCTVHRKSEAWVITTKLNLFFLLLFTLVIKNNYLTTMYI